MRRSPWSLPLVLLATAATAVAAACGTGARLTADSPGQAVTAALEAAQTTPLVMSFTGSFSLDSAGLKGVPASLQPSLAELGSGGSASGRLIQASSNRREVTLSAAGHTYTLVQYDGHGYVRRDGGGFAELAKALPSGSTLSGATLSAAVDALGFQDVTKAGDQTMEHYQATLTAASLEKLVEALSGSGSNSSSSQLQQVVTMLAPFLTLRGASADVWVSHATGALVRASLGGSFSVDVGKIASAFAGFAPPGALGKSLPSGTLSGSLSFGATVSHYGGSLTVTKPVATATLPAKSGFAGWIGDTPSTT
jgi:hypothetical protein